MLTTKERAVLVGQRIVAARKRKGMSQVKLAKALAEYYGWPDAPGVADPEGQRRSLGINERGESAPRLHRLQAIATITEQPLEFFVVDGDNGDGSAAEPFQDVA